MWCQRSIIRTLALSFCQSFALNLFDCSYLYNCIAVSTVFLIHDMYIALQYGTLGQMHRWDQGSVTRTLPFDFISAYISNVFEWIEPCDARLILFHTGLHYIP